MVPRKTVTALPRFGAFLVQLRESFRWRQAQAADIATRRELAVSRQALRGLEEGKTQSPEPELLRAVAQLYKVPYEELVRRYVHERYGIDLTPDGLAAALQERFGSSNRVVLEADEPDLVDAWRHSTAEGQHAALTVLKASRKKHKSKEARTPSEMDSRRRKPPRRRASGEG